MSEQQSAGTALTVLERAAVALGASEREKALAELARKAELETLDFHGALESIVERFGHRQDAAPVIKAINAYLKKRMRETPGAE